MGRLSLCLHVSAAIAFLCALLCLLSYIVHGPFSSNDLIVGSIAVVLVNTATIAWSVTGRKVFILTEILS